MKKVFGNKIIATACALFALNTYNAAAQTPRPEYPRPQFERSTWQNLNGTWTYTFDFGLTGGERGFQKNHKALTEK